MKNCVKRDSRSVTLNAPYDVLSGQGMLVGALFAVANVDALSGVELEADRLGHFLLTKSTGASTGGAQGAIAYWDNSAKAVTAVSSGNTNIGYFAKTCANGDATCEVILKG